jgi:hypothetical protein
MKKTVPTDLDGLLLKNSGAFLLLLKGKRLKPGIALFVKALTS